MDASLLAGRLLAKVGTASSNMTEQQQLFSSNASTFSLLFLSVITT